MQRTRKNQLFFVLLTASSYLSSIHAQTATGCVPTDVCASSTNWGSQQYRCEDGKAVLMHFGNANCSDIVVYAEYTNYTCSSTTPCTDYMHVRVYQEPYTEWSYPNNTEEGSCATFHGATTGAYDVNYYNFTVTNYSTITIDSCGSPYDTYLYFLTADGTVIDECDDCGGCGVQTILTVYNVAPGDYQIGIGGFSSEFGEYAVTVYCEESDYYMPQTTDDTGPYPTWSWPDNTDVHPTWWWPDNTEEGSCGTFYGATTAAYDIDYYDFNVTNYTTIILDSCASSLDTYLYFLAANGSVITQGDFTGHCGFNEILTIYNVPPGQYQIGIGGYSTDYGRYAVTVYCEDNFIPTTTAGGRYWTTYNNPNVTYALNEDICDSDTYREFILPVGCEQTGPGDSQYQMCSLEGITFHWYDSNDCSSELSGGQNFSAGCHVDHYGITWNVDIIECVVEGEVIAGDIETTQETSTTTEDGTDESGVDGVGWMLATVVMVAIMILFE